MSQLAIRQLLIDLTQPFPLRWNGDAFTSAFMNALSLSFPVGEQFFLDSVRDGLKQLPEGQQALFKEEVKGFIGQEATHRRLHALYNRHLTDQGMVNHWEQRALKRIAILKEMDIRHSVAATAANEHYTAVFAHWLLSNEWFFNNAEPRLKTLWLWHASEESEHRCTAFDMYQRLAAFVRQRWLVSGKFRPVARLLQTRLSPFATPGPVVETMAATTRRRLHTGSTSCLIFLIPQRTTPC